MTWQAAVAEALKSAPHASKIYWFHGLDRFEGWEKFVQWLVQRRNGIRFSHKSRDSVALRYTGQRIVVFALTGVAPGERVDHVFESMQKLKSGVLFCPENGVKTFPTPHVVVFADFPVPCKKRALAEAAETPAAEVKVEVKVEAEVKVEVKVEAPA